MTWTLLLRVVVASIGLALFTLWLTACAPPDKHMDWEGFLQDMKEKRQ